MGYRIPEFSNSGNYEFGTMGFGIRNTAQGIRDPTNDWHLESKFH